MFKNEILKISAIAIIISLFLFAYSYFIHAGIARG